MRILVVDDDPNMAALLATWCRHDGHEVTLSTSAIEALARVTADPPELVITDAKMPDMDGLSLVRHVRARHPSVMAIVVTGYSDYCLETVVAAGASDLLLKPLRATELTARIRLAERTRDQLQQLASKQRALQVRTTEIIQSLKRELAEERSARRARGPLPARAGRR